MTSTLQPQQITFHPQDQITKNLKFLFSRLEHSFDAQQVTSTVYILAQQLHLKTVASEEESLDQILKAIEIVPHTPLKAFLQKNLEIIIVEIIPDESQAKRLLQIIEQEKQCIQNSTLKQLQAGIDEMLSLESNNSCIVNFKRAVPMRRDLYSALASIENDLKQNILLACINQITTQLSQRTILFENTLSAIKKALQKIEDEQAHAFAQEHLALIIVAVIVDQNHAQALCDQLPT